MDGRFLVDRGHSSGRGAGGGAPDHTGALCLTALRSDLSGRAPRRRPSFIHSVCAAARTACRRAVRRGTRTHGAASSRSHLPARLLVMPIASPGELDPAMFADALPPWVDAPARVWVPALHHCPDRRLRRDDLSCRTAVRRGGRRAPHLLATIPRHPGRADRATRRPVRRLPVDRLPFDAFARAVHVRSCRAGSFVLGGRTARPVPPVDAIGGATCCASSASRYAATTPYAGGCIPPLRPPREGVHALQIEIARELYMDEGNIERLPGFAAVQAAMTRFIAGLASNAGVVGGS